jgi:hypothetical protein
MVIVLKSISFGAISIYSLILMPEGSAARALRLQDMGIRISPQIDLFECC